MSDEVNMPSQEKPLWDGANYLSKPEKRNILFKETGDRCMICGKHRSETEEWAMTRIIPGNRTRYLQLEGRAIICMDCYEKKQHTPLPQFVGSQPFGRRFSYWRRVCRGARKGLISPEKKALFLTGFSLLRRNDEFTRKKKLQKFRWILLNETLETCVYCGTPLTPPTATFDHIIPRALGGKSSIENYVIACQKCNSEKGMTPVDEYVRNMPEKKRISYVNRVKNLASSGHLPEQKAKLLLSFENEHTRRFRFRFFKRLFSVFIIQTRI